MREDRKTWVVQSVQISQTKRNKTTWTERLKKRTVCGRVRLRGHSARLPGPLGARGLNGTAKPSLGRREEWRD